MGLLYSNIPELQGSNTEIALGNLAELEQALEALIEKRLAHLSELSTAMLGDGEDIDIVKSIILSVRTEGNADSGNILNENRPAADAIFQKFSLIERITLFKEIFGKRTVKNGAFPLFESDTLKEVSAEASERIAYLKNSYNDAAYMQFSSLLTSPRAAYFSSITDVCDSVYRGECEYSILPIETSADGKLLSFYELILKYGFKINAVYDLYSDGGKEYTRYALLSRQFLLRDTNLRSKARNRYFEFMISENDGIPQEDLLTAASYCTLKLRRIDTLQLRNEKGTRDTYFCPVLRADGSDMQAFLAFLAIDCPDFIPIGIYMQI